MTSNLYDTESYTNIDVVAITSSRSGMVRSAVSRKRAAEALHMMTENAAADDIRRRVTREEREKEAIDTARWCGMWSHIKRIL